jgi:hypothetical protein
MQQFNPIHILPVRNSMKYMKFSNTLLCVASAAVVIILSANAANAQAIETKVYVPPSSLVFKNLDSLTKAKVSWQGLSSFSQKSNYTNKYTIALNLGTRICDAFLAVQAKDKKNFNGMAMTVTGLSNKLGADIEQTMNEKMFDMVKKDKWTEVRGMLDEQQNTVKDKLNKLDKDAAVLVTVGGWLQGLTVVSKALAGSYNADATSIIRNPKLIDYLMGELNGLGAVAKGNDVAKKISAQLPAIKNLVNIDKSKPVPVENVKKLAQLTAGLVKEIESAK